MDPETLLAQAGDTGVSIQTVLGLISAAVAALVTVIGVLWRQVHSNMIGTEERLTKKLDECETKHEAANSTLLTLAGKVGHLEGEVKVYEAVNARTLKLVEGAHPKQG